MDEVVTTAQLGKLGGFIAQGGQARIYHAPGLTLADAPGPLVFKEYKPGHEPPHGLRKLVAIRNGLDPAERARLAQFAAWPLRVVQDGAQIRGVVMPLIPPAFTQDRKLPGTGKRSSGPREVQNLFISPDRASLVGIPLPGLAERLAICRDLAAALHFVHKRNLVFGDLNAKNELYRTGAKPRVMLVDCDGIRIKGNMAVVAQLNAPDWDPPERLLTQQSDLYKYGLFVLRCLGTGDQLSTTRDPRRADPALNGYGKQLLRAALSAVPGERTTAQQWGRYFDGKPPVPTQSVTRQDPDDRAPGWKRVAGRWVRQ